MKDRRNEVLARQLLEYSVELKKGEVLYLEIKGKETLELGKEIIRIATEKGATTFWYYNDESLLRQFVGAARNEQFTRQAGLHLPLMKAADAYIGLRGSDNPFDMADIPHEQMEMQNSLFYKPVHLEERVKRTRWVVLRFPNNAMAQLAETSQEKFESFYYDVCCADYAKMSKAQDKLKALIDFSGIRSLTVLTMEVPCCRGLLQLARRAAAESERKIPIQWLEIGVRGDVLQDVG